MTTSDISTSTRLAWGTEDLPEDHDPDARPVEVAASGDGGAGPATKPAADGPRSAGGTSSRFLADLTKAMQAAAQAERQDTLTRLHADANRQVEEVRSQATGDTADLRRRADDDVAAVREWSKAEIARIRDETESGIAARKARLETEIEEHATRIEAAVERVHQRVATFEQRMGAFFEQLMSEEDPSRFAALAGTLPDAPALDDAAYGTAEPLTGVGEDSEADVTSPADFAAAELEAARSGVDLADDSEPAEPLLQEVGEPGDAELGMTRVVVTGLVSVASIAAFKRQLVRVPGVQSVGVSSGPEGEFVYAVRHTPTIALRDGVATLAGFSVRITGGEANRIEAIVHDPESQAEPAATPQRS